ncbi:glycosyl hydrolase-related protein [Pseudalkalibacillus decolorationis]|uniref:glycosyl hydrolase-related protein n=1 Tax=Pseudalkalibacillus decolorationis TaxID=163879 RepID=UPI0021497547|nr:glycosyl hydrolase-related protein [Pseudalkalibacillus decolorationis]
MLSVVKKAEQDEGLVIRLFNPSRAEGTDSVISFKAEVEKSEEVNLNEEAIRELEPKDGTFSMTHHHCQQKSYKVHLKQ